MIGIMRSDGNSYRPNPRARFPTQERSGKRTSGSRPGPRRSSGPLKPGYERRDGGGGSWAFFVDQHTAPACQSHSPDAVNPTSEIWTNSDGLVRKDVTPSVLLAPRESRGPPRGGHPTQNDKMGHSPEDTRDSAVPTRFARGPGRSVVQTAASALARDPRTDG